MKMFQSKILVTRFCFISVAELERQMRVEHETLPDAVVDLRREIARFRAKLEAADHLREMGKSPF